MIIIGEKINGAIKSVAEAIQNKDAEFIQSLAIKQEKAGAHYLDVCSGTATKIESETLRWLIETVQSVVEIPLCIDSPSPEVIEEVLPVVKKLGIVNSVVVRKILCKPPLSGKIELTMEVLNYGEKREKQTSGID